MSVAELEAMELENSGGWNAQNCALLLIKYLLADDLLNAKFIWKRTPAAAKVENEELTSAWAISKMLWAKDFQGFFALVKQRQWADYLAPLIAELINKTRQRVFRLICLAYTVVRVSDFAAMVDLPVESAVQFATSPENAPECRWTYDPQSQMLEKPWSRMVIAGGKPSDKRMMIATDQDKRQFDMLTGYVSFLEN